MAIDKQEGLNLDEKDVSREGLTTGKVVHSLRVFFQKKATEVLESYDKFLDIDFENLKTLGKKGIILDIDECVAPHHGEILPENLDKIKQLLKENWEIVIFSNMKKSDRYAELEELGIKVITSKFAKPDKRGFEECKDSFNGLGKEELIMIGDNFLTDGGAIQAGIDFIKLKPIETQEESRSIARQVQITVRSIVDTIAKKRGNI